MILNNDQLRARAREFALTNELNTAYKLPVRYWPAFRAEVSSLHEFAEQLGNHKAMCKQPAEDWLLDHINFIETQAQVVLRELPRSTLRKLPKLQSTGMPRIYALCDDYLEHVDGRYDTNSFELYLSSYQEVSVLKDVECWALPSAVRVRLIHRLAILMCEVRHRHEVCHSITSLLEQVGAKNLSDEKIRALLNKETEKKPLGPIEIVHFVQHLSEWEPNIQTVHDWLRVHVENSQASLEQMVSFEHQLQAELQVTCGNLVQSLHFLERLPWRLTFARISYLEKILRADSEYKQLDLASRDLLREHVTAIAHQLKAPETLVAQTAIKLAKCQRDGKNSEELLPRRANLAYYLLDPYGIKDLRAELSKISRPRVLPQIAVRRHPSLAYFSSVILLFAVLLLVIGGWVALGMDIRPISWLAIFVALMFPVSEWVMTIINEVICKCCRPIPLLRLDFSKKLPVDAKTIVVIPIIWSSKEEVDEVVNRLLVHYLANRQPNIYFGILADFLDAETETLPNDASIIEYAVKRITALNKKYGDEKFFLFHRSRIYHQVDKIYMGWERKRGKLVEFVELLSGSNETSYSTIYGQKEALKDIRYIFTCDQDTQLPIGVVSRLAGTIHFPYNRPRLNKDGTRVLEGFGIIQPRIGMSFESTQQSRFAALWAGEPGIDPYAFAVSNSYQDLFGQGIFVGKGIFDVEVFQKVLVNRIPNQHVLSHDLLEGGLLRTGLTPDIEVVESHPSTFYSYQSRAHRWIRGDWQLIKWLGLKCQDRHGEKKPVDLGGLPRWQIINNLRHSLLDPALLIVSILGLGILPGRSWVWETIVAMTVFLPFLRAVVISVLEWRLSNSVAVSFLQSGIRLMVLPFSAVLSLDAILRTLYRVFVSRRNLLEWVSFAQSDRRSKKGPVLMFEQSGYLIMILFAVVAWFSSSAFAWMVGLGALIIWMLARPVIKQINLPKIDDNRSWVKEARPELNNLAQKIWSFYDRYVTEAESWLPPDNVQYQPKEIIAHRTSPTNIGLYLASVIAARDLEFIDTNTMLRRIESSIRTIERMEKWNGHLLNWYDTCSLAPLFPKYVSTVDSGNFVAYLMVVRQGLLDWGQREADSKSVIKRLTEDIDQIIEQTNFKALYNPDERLFCLGFHVDANQRDVTLYDLLASEARQASYVAIALGQIPVSHWFTLARTMTLSGKCKTLLSWSGTMFEYLMPSLIMRTYRNTIWDSTYQGVIHRQQEYTNQYRVPFGISESGYYAFDYQLNYQYRAFGVPGLGLDRGLEQNLVLAPYATIMALPFAGKNGFAALNKFKDYEANGKFGFYEAVDFTAVRLPKGKRYQVVQSYMAHHQGMSMLSLINLLADDIMIKRFSQDTRVRSADLLLQERIPKKAAFIKEPIGIHSNFPVLDRQVEEDTDSSFIKPTIYPKINILSNHRMTSISTNQGTGMITWNGLAITRWKEDPVVDTSGPIIYLQDVLSEEYWSITRFPCQGDKAAKTMYRLDKTSYEAVNHNISAKMEITVSSDTDAEVRRLQLVNQGDEERILEVTTFLELALANPAADLAHPAFNKLFIETSHDPMFECLLAKRRAREEEEPETWCVHSIYVDGSEAGNYEFETDRANFIGRGYSLHEPKAMSSRLNGSTGSVTDPAFVMRRRIHLAPKESATIFIITGVAESREQVLEMIQQFGEANQVARTFHLSWIRSQIDLRHLHLTEKQAKAAHLLAGRLLYTPPLSEGRRNAITANALGQSSLWSHGISGDVPIILVKITNLADLSFVILLARQHQYLCTLGLAIDLVVLDATVGGYQDQLMNRLHDQLASAGIGHMKRMVFLKESQLLANEVNLLYAVTRVFLRAGGPSLRAQLRLDESEKRLLHQATPKPITIAHGGQHPISSNYEFFNGWGGFVDNGKAYELQVQEGTYLPRPWSNVLANPSFGCLLTDFGTGYSWWRNSRECKLTPWTNDPVLDQPGECLYISDCDTNQIWSATPKPAGSGLTYKVTHGWGFSRFEQLSGDVVHTMETIVPLKDSLKLIQLRLQNQSKATKKISITYYAEWVLGVMREAQAPYIVTEWDQDCSALLARNTFQESFREAISFLHLSMSDGKSNPSYSWTGDRQEFIGYGGTLEQPSALLKEKLSKRTGAFSNTCGAVQTVVELPPEEEVTMTILFGCASSKAEVHSLIRTYSSSTAYEAARMAVYQYWQHLLGQVQVKTPDRAMDIMMNGWLLYQTLTSRLWARTAFYQAGGAFGFRDQLQDSLGFLHAEPSITRKQILINAAHQYKEGDVQHWWHEETKKGIRTKFSDDLLWLPYTVSRYLNQTGDYSVLNENIPFLVSEVLKEEEMERYEDTVISDETGSVLEHSLRSIRQALRFGEHGIPLMGIGDWNDGMSRIGAKGRGESVWLGWFLLDILKRFLNLPAEVLPHDTVIEFEKVSHELVLAMNQHAWDGAWFRRAFTDAGTWIGSNQTRECRIDAIAQSWAVISQGTSADRQSRAMLSFDRELVDRDLKLARLLTKPFDVTKPSPGYIQGYPPGIRENGGQYTHGVIWGIVAWAMLERGDKAFELFSMLNPIAHTQTFRDVQIYQNEPYVMSADVYTADPHQGRGGWSWYTGAAGWMYQAGLEYILGLKVYDDRLSIQPSVPSNWKSFTIDYRYGKTTYSFEIHCQQEHSVPIKWVVDGKDLGNQSDLKLVDDGELHQVIVHLGLQPSRTVG